MEEESGGTGLRCTLHQFHAGVCEQLYIEEVYGELHLILVMSNETEIDAGYVGTVPVVTYTVTFVDYNGETLKTQTVTSDSSATAPTNIPDRAGYTFIDWDKAFINVTSNLTVTAQYQKIEDDVVTYTVKFVDHDGIVLKTEVVEKGKAATAPADPVRDGYTFTGWDKAFDNVTSNLTVFAQYEEIPSNDPRIRISDATGSTGLNFFRNLEHQSKDNSICISRVIGEPHEGTAALKLAGFRIVHGVSARGRYKGQNFVIEGQCKPHRIQFRTILQRKCDLNLITNTIRWKV